MKDEEFAELNLLGNRLNQNNKNNYKKKNKNFEFKKKDSKKKILRVFKIIIKILKRTSLKIWNKIKFNFQKLKFRLDRYFLYKKNKKGYKIVEIKKEKRNKVIIIRKRVPINYQISKKIVTKKPCIYYFNLDSDQIKNIETKIISHDKLKKSIWDFPIKR